MYDVWSRVLYGKFLELNDIALNLYNKPDFERQKKFERYLRKFLRCYDVLDLEQQGQFHELVCYGLEEQAMYVKF